MRRQDDSTRARATSFGSIASEYDRLRPAPHPDAVDWAVPGHHQRVVEIGAGTGKLTRLLAERRHAVYAVEPDRHMGEVLVARVPGAVAIAARGEELPLAAHSADALVASSAWHWLEESRAVAEVLRVLVPGGWFSLLWAGPDRSVEWMRSLWAGGRELGQREAAAIDGHRRDRHHVDLGSSADEFTEPERRTVKWVVPMARADLLGLAGTYSAVLALPPQERRAHVAAMSEFLDGHRGPGSADPLAVPMRCICWRARTR
ncbi:MAG TPA: class I SAM-dependent methyltransferase [Acidimicrobiales bacterium]|nr:class I SAM-dependent methyltransferase [Acidimicrobiales bacterium]